MAVVVCEVGAAGVREKVGWVRWRGKFSVSRENRRGVAGGWVGSSWSTKAVTMLIR